VAGQVSLRVEVFIGPFGSGKTEVAINRALSANSEDFLAANRQAGGQ